jgi:hypothetical protein
MKKNVFKIVISVLILVTGSIQSQTRIWNQEILKKAKTSMSNATDKIFKEADHALSTDITTVMDKDIVPPGGDKHDYISMGKYWWPDPKNPTGPYIRHDGHVNPEVEKFDRAALGNMAKSVTSLSLAYYLTSNEKYAAKAVRNLRIWFLNPATKMNPNMNYGQTIFGRNGGKGRGEGVLDSYSFVEMLDGVELLKGSKSFTEADLNGLTNWFNEYLNWLMTSEIGNEEYSGKNNHGTAFDVQVTRYALFLEKEDIARKYINDFAKRRIFEQIEPDGTQPLELVRETAFGYSTFNVTHMLDMAFIAKGLNIDLFNATAEDGRNINKALTYLVQFIGKPSRFPYKQIKDWKSVENKLILELYRADRLAEKPAFEKFYKNKMDDLEKFGNLIFN